MLHRFGDSIAGVNKGHAAMRNQRRSLQGFSMQAFSRRCDFFATLLPTFFLFQGVGENVLEQSVPLFNLQRYRYARMKFLEKLMVKVLPAIKPCFDFESMKAG